MVKLAATGGRLLKPAVEKSGLADEQGWNWKIKELKKQKQSEGKGDKKKERGGEGKEGVKQTVLWLPRFTKNI